MFAYAARVWYDLIPYIGCSDIRPMIREMTGAGGFS